METKTVYEELKIKLTNKRRIEKGARFAAAQEAIKRADAELATAKADHKGAVEPLEREIDEIGVDLRQGYEFGDIKVEESPLENWMVKRVRLDTGEELESRAMTPDERQKELELQEAQQIELDFQVDDLGHRWPIIDPDSIKDGETIVNTCELCSCKTGTIGAGEDCPEAERDPGETVVEIDMQGHRWDPSKIGVARVCLGCGAGKGTVQAEEECQKPASADTTASGGLNTAADIMPEDDTDAGGDS